MDPDAKKIHVYGASKRYGQADHEMTQDILKYSMPGYEVTWTNE